MKKWLLFILLLATTAVATACNTSASGDPALAVQTYLQAKVNGDETNIRRLLCSEMEQVAEREIHTFDAVQDVTIEGMACTDAGNGRVQCSGTIQALYGSEQTEFALSTYRVVEEDGEWKWCGETQ